MKYLRAITRKLLRDIAHLWGQGVAVGIITACGVGILVMALGALSSITQSRDTYYDRYRFADVFAELKRAPQGLIGELQSIEGVRIAETRIRQMVPLDIDGFGEPANGQLVSLPDEDEPRLNTLYLHQGRWPDLNRSDEVLINKSFADAHGFRSGDRITATLNGQRRDLVVTGIADSPEFIFALGPGALLPDDERFGIFWMRQRTLEAVFDLDGAFNSVLISLSPSAISDSVLQAVDDILDPYGGTGAIARSDQTSDAFISSEIQQMAAMAQIIPPIFLLVSAFLIHSILSRLIATERQQVGLLKAFGYTSREIARHYVGFALILTLGGILAGFVIGVLLARLLTYQYSDTFRFPDMLFTVAPSAFVWGALAASGAAVFGAFNAAMKAARLDPAEAMRPEPPAVYRRSWLLQSELLDAPTRMICRHIGRWPVRAGITVFGISSSMCLLVGILFSFDALDATIESRFFRTDPHDAQIQFFEAVDARALDEVRRLDGVIAAEPVRSVAARFHNGHVKELGAITGITPKSDLKRLVAQDGRLARPAESGLILSSQMAGMLGAMIGDQIRVEVLEGRRPDQRLPVLQIVEDDVGWSVYMGIEALNRLMGERAVMTGAFASLDPRRIEAFSDAILERPVIASVLLQKPAMASFADTLEETVTVMMTIYGLIGGAIAAGVAYNSARISLTERGREFASLRVLGFTEGEVAYILLGELAVLTLLALPIGLFLGRGLAWLVVVGMSSDLYRIPYVIDPSTYGLAGLIVVGSAVLAGWLVVRRVKQLDLIEVLKTRE